MVIAIDPGASGGIATRHNDLVSASRMPTTPAAIASHLKLLISTTPEPPTVFIEAVGSHRQGNNAQASATFARHCGFLEGVLAAHNITPVHVQPRKWQSELFAPGVLTPGSDPASKRQRKNQIKDHMSTLHPHLKVTLMTSDALAILAHSTGIRHLPHTPTTPEPPKSFFEAIADHQS